MTTLTSPIPIGDQQYNARLTVPQIAELERKLDCPAGAILGRLLTGCYIGPDGSIVDGALVEAGFKDADITEVIYHALCGGGSVDPGRARELVQTYVAEMPRKPSWLIAANLMRVYMEGYTPPKKPEAPARKSRRGRAAATGVSTTAHT
jgi:hypothetical protein